MIIPLGTDRPLRRPTLVNHALLAITVLVYLAQAATNAKHQALDSNAGPAIFQDFVLSPGHSRWWTYLTYAFLHADFMHILGNMVTLLVFGPCVEDRLGRIGFALFYLGGAVAAGMLHAAFSTDSVIGASGAIAAVTGAFLVLFPWTHIRCFWFLGIIGVYQIPALWLIGARIALDVYGTGTGRSGKIATLAHLGGYAYGIVIAFTLLATHLLAREPYDLLSWARQTKRRREFRSLPSGNGSTKARGQPPAYALRAAKRDQEAANLIAQARAEVATRWASGDAPGAAKAYRELIEKHGAEPGVALLSRHVQYDLANYVLQSGDHGLAFAAYDLFARGYPSDRETPVVRLTLGLILARYLNDPVRAKQEINAAMPGLAEESSCALANELLVELG